MGTPSKVGRPRGSAFRDSVFDHLKNHPGLAVCEIAVALGASTNQILVVMNSFKEQNLVLQVGKRRIPRPQGGVMIFPGWKLIDDEATRRPTKMNNRELGCDVQHILLGLGRAQRPG